MLWTPLLAAALLLAPQAGVVALPLDQEPITTAKKTDPGRKLHGRFLHMTDFHPDPFYVAGGDPEEKCHRGSGAAGHLGAPVSSCDSPWSLIDETLQWVQENMRDQIDFVVWTGDSARHDNDDNIPRSPTQIYDLNRKTVDKVVDVFRTRENETSLDPQSHLYIPVVPTLGNNDIFPHNIMEPGPSQVTRQYTDIWKWFVPENQFHVFQKGAYFWQQVLPGRNGEWGSSTDGGLAVFSLNSLYFFDSNAAVDGCAKPSEPGYEQMEWLKVQLGIMRDRNMKVIIIGHVPPAWTNTKQSWDETCWEKYVLWSRQYRDVIVGHIYGHMNLDHFFVLDSDKGRKPRDGKKRNRKKKNNGRGKNSGKSSILDSVLRIFFGHVENDICHVDDFDPEADPVLSVASASTYLQSLREEFAELPRPNKGGRSEVSDYQKLIGGKWGERFMVTHVGPSVVPNYFPTLRVFEYNITGLVDEKGSFSFNTEPTNAETEMMKKKKKKKPKKPKMELPEGPAKTAPPGPAYSMQPFTFTGYTQYFLNLTKYSPLHDPKESDGIDGEQKPVKFEVLYDTRTDKVYKLKDLTVRSYLKLAHKIVDARKPAALEGRSTPSLEDYEAPTESDVDDDDAEDIDLRGRKGKKKKHHKGKKRDRIWHKFVERAFIGTMPPEEVEQFRISAVEQCELNEL